MEVVVRVVNEGMSLFAVETDNGFTVFEFSETDHIETGDVVSGSLEAAACDSLFNYSRRVELAVYVRALPIILAGSRRVFFESATEVRYDEICFSFSTGQENKPDYAMIELPELVRAHLTDGAVMDGDATLARRFGRRACQRALVHQQTCTCDLAGRFDGLDRFALNI